MNSLVKILKAIKRIQREQYSKRMGRKFQSVGSNFHVRALKLLNGQYISVGNDFIAMDGCRIEAWNYFEGQTYTPYIFFGNNVSMNLDCHISAINHIAIGNNVLLGSRVFITDHGHGKGENGEVDIPPNRRKLYSKGSVIIEDNVWIGEGACILPNVKIGYGSIIGANAVVTKDIPCKSVVGGVPAKVIRSM